MLGSPSPNMSLLAPLAAASKEAILVIYEGRIFMFGPLMFNTPVLCRARPSRTCSRTTPLYEDAFITLVADYTSHNDTHSLPCPGPTKDCEKDAGSSKTDSEQAI